MRSIFLLVHVLGICLLTIGAKSHVAKKSEILNKEIKVLYLKLKKELTDKKLTPHRKYTLSILAARELNQLKSKKEALEFYQIAKNINVDEFKGEIDSALASSKPTSLNIFFFEVNLKELIQKKFFEKAILSLNPEMLKLDQFAKYRIIYDLLNVRIKRKKITDLYCFHDFQKDPDNYYQYSTLLCDFLIDYLKNKKTKNNHLLALKEYFLTHDLEESYLQGLAIDLVTIP
jgi:hypothetical protein